MVPAADQEWVWRSNWRNKRWGRSSKQNPTNDWWWRAHRRLLFQQLIRIPNERLQKEALEKIRGQSQAARQWKRPSCRTTSHLRTEGLPGHRGARALDEQAGQRLPWGGEEIHWAPKAQLQSIRSPEEAPRGKIVWRRVQQLKDYRRFQRPTLSFTKNNTE